MVVRYKNNWIPTKTLDEMSGTNTMSLLWDLVLVEGQSYKDFVNCGKIKELKRLEFWKKEINYFIPMHKIFQRRM